MSQYHSIDAGETERFFTVVARASGAPIVAGTVNYYLKAKSGADAGKWWKNSDQTWAVAETANAMTHDADGHWEIDLASTPFADGVRYLEYVKESGDLHVPQARHLIGKAVVETTLISVGTGAGQINALGGKVPATAEGDTGITLEKVLEMLAAFIAGKVSRSSAGGVTTLSYKKRDGTTTSFTSVCDEDDGDRTTTGSLS